MKLHDLKAGTNPRRLRIFLAEKGLSVPTVQLDMASGENRQPAYLAINPLGTMPAPRYLCMRTSVPPTWNISQTVRSINL